MSARRGYVFISFKSEDRDIAKKLKDVLEGHGFRVWWQEAIQVGQEWHGELDKAVANAGCVVVLWSPAAMQSAWVRHEASQAIVREVYTPARIEPLEIQAPYNHVQATDMIRWDGNPSHPGFVNLLARIESLLPAPVPIWRRVCRAVWRSRVTLLSVLVAATTLGMLFRQVRLANVQLTEMGELVNQQRALAREFERSLHPIQSIEVTAWVGVALSSPELIAYRNRVAPLLGMYAGSSVGPDSQPPSGVSITTQDSLGPTAFSIHPESSLWPDEEGEWKAYYVLRYVDLSLDFHQRPTPAESLFLEVQGAPQADLAINTGTANLDESEFSLEWNIRHTTLAIQYSETLDPKYWRTNRHIMSIPDIMQSQFVVKINSVMVRSDSDQSEIDDIQRARSALELNMLLLRISGRDFWFRKDQLKVHTAPDGLRYYVARFADAQED